MKRYAYRGGVYSITELSEMSGIAPHTLRDRLRRGYPVEEAVKMTATHDSVREFGEASYWKDWIGLSTNDLHAVYWRWCVSQGYTPLQLKGFSRQLFANFPMLKTVPTSKRDGNYRVIRER